MFRKDVGIKPPDFKSLISGLQWKSGKCGNNSAEVYYESRRGQTGSISCSLRLAKHPVGSGEAVTGTNYVQPSDAHSDADIKGITGDAVESTDSGRFVPL